MVEGKYMTREGDAKSVHESASNEYELEIGKQQKMNG